MTNLFQAATADKVKSRIAQLRPDSARLWGKMTPAQMLAHCAASMEDAVGMTSPPRIFIGRLVGPLAKRSLIYTDEPMRKNSPTAKGLRVTDERDFDTERQRLLGVVDCFATGGPEKCTKHPHSFFGSLTPPEWSSLMYKHLDHHLRQFGV